MYLDYRELTETSMAQVTGWFLSGLAVIMAIAIFVMGKDAADDEKVYEGGQYDAHIVMKGLKTKCN